jgi:hypothetical protein
MGMRAVGIPTAPIFTTTTLGSGSKASPSITWSANTGNGLYYRAGTFLVYASGGKEVISSDATGIYIPESVQFAATGTDFSITNPDVKVQRMSPAVLAVRGFNNAAAEWRVEAGNGGYMALVKSVTESLAVAAAATTVSATSIPAGSILLAVTARVTAAIPTAATFTVATTVGGTALHTAAVSTALNSTDKGTAAGASYRAAATTVTITPNVVPGAATGVVRLQFYYIDVAAATS